MADHFKSTRNIESSFKQIRWMALAVVIGSFSTVIYSQYSVNQQLEKSREKVYILDNGHSLLAALAQDQNINRPAEMKSHLEQFHRLFFEQDPNEKAIVKRIEQANYLGDESIYRLYSDLKEHSFFSDLVAGNVTEKFELDSISLDTRQSPYHAVTYGRQIFVRSSTISVRRLVTDCYLVNAKRTDENPHGFQIERLRVINNSEIQRINRDVTQITNSANDYSRTQGAVQAGTNPAN